MENLRLNDLINHAAIEVGLKNVFIIDYKKNLFSNKNQWNYFKKLCKDSFVLNFKDFKKFSKSEQEKIVISGSRKIFLELKSNLKDSHIAKLKLVTGVSICLINDI